MAKRREPPRTVKGRDIELHASDGQAVDIRAQIPFLHPPAAKKEGLLDRLVGKTPFGKAAKALKRD